jgi:hypothetical protein
LKAKGEVFDKFKAYKALVENQTGMKINTLRSDNGGVLGRGGEHDDLHQESMPN